MVGQLVVGADEGPNFDIKLLELTGVPVARGVIDAFIEVVALVLPDRGDLGVAEASQCGMLALLRRTDFGGLSQAAGVFARILRRGRRVLEPRVGIVGAALHRSLVWTGVRRLWAEYAPGVIRLPRGLVAVAAIGPKSREQPPGGFHRGHRVRARWLRGRSATLVGALWATFVCGAIARGSGRSWTASGLGPGWPGSGFIRRYGRFRELLSGIGTGWLDRGFGTLRSGVGARWRCRGIRACLTRGSCAGCVRWWNVVGRVGALAGVAGRRTEPARCRGTGCGGWGRVGGCGAGVGGGWAGVLGGGGRGRMWLAALRIRQILRAGCTGFVWGEIQARGSCGPTLLRRGVVRRLVRALVGGVLSCRAGVLGGEVETRSGRRLVRAGRRGALRRQVQALAGALRMAGGSGGLIGR